MASSVWSTVQGNVPEVGAAAVDPTSMLNSQLASALSTMGDAQYWEESIAPSTIRTELSSADPSNPNSTPILLRGMKWLLACMSKGRDVSDFYPHVVKLVGANSLEVRKMVYMYLVHYADHDPTTRELSLLSINSFQRGLADNEQLIRALALRVMSSIRVLDVLQIQILAVQKCAKDKSPYVRKCAANALAKLSPRCDDSQRQMLLDIMKALLEEDTSTMVLTSTIIGFAELCPERLELLHGSFRKVCHLLTDMDEWGQVVVIDTLARYCRKFFKKPKRIGSAEEIDQEKRVRRTVSGIATAEAANVAAALEALVQKETGVTPLPTRPKKIKRRVVKKGFYSDEEDESTEEEIDLDHINGSTSRQRDSFGQGGMMGQHMNKDGDEDEDLDEDHRLLLRSSFPLLKSRNSGVVLAVCSLHYYCGVASVKVRSALGKALVRIHRDRREIQYVVLTSIRSLVMECPSAFTPYLNEFFVTAMDPSYSRMIKLEILTSLSLDPPAIEAVLKELRTYIRHDDKSFVCASVRAVGRVVELARIVHDRHGRTSGDPSKERKAANLVALNCLYGLMTLTQTCQHEQVVGECAIVMQQIILQLMSDSGEFGSVEDPGHVESHAMHRLLLLVTRSLSSERDDNDDDDSEVDEDDTERKGTELEALTVQLPPPAVGAALWIVGEWISSVSKVPVLLYKLDSKTRTKLRSETIRLVGRAFPDLDPYVKLQGIHLATKLLVSSAAGEKSDSREAPLCEHVLSLGRVDVNTNVRDRARNESALVQVTIGLKHDIESLPTAPPVGRSLTLDNAKRILLLSKPVSSSLPLEEESDPNSEIKGPFRFGTLSSLVSHRARTAYLPLPNWAEKDSPSSLREPPASVAQQTSLAEDGDYGWKVDKNKSANFYESDDSSSSSSSASDSSSSSGADQSSSEESDDESSSDESSSESETDTDSEELVQAPPTQQTTSLIPVTNGRAQSISIPKTQALLDQSSSSESDSESEESSDDSESSNEPAQTVGNLLAMSSAAAQPANQKSDEPKPASNGTSLADDLQGLVMAPVVVETDEVADSDIEKDSSSWMQLVRPELGGGLLVSARYLRGPTRQREAKLAGLDPEQPTTVMLQLKFENRRTDAGTLRRVRIIQRSSSTGSIAPQRLVAPPEIMALKKGQMSTATVGISFQSASDREGALQARLDIKSDRGSNAVDIKPPLGELLRPCRMSSSDFDSSMNKLQGFQRVESVFMLSPGEESLEEAYKALPHTILKYAALTPLHRKAEWKDDRFALTGKLPATMDPVYIVVKCNRKTGSGSITVCCDHALAVTSLMDLLKRAIAT